MGSWHPGAQILGDYISACGSVAAAALSVQRAQLAVLSNLSPKPHRGMEADLQGSSTVVRSLKFHWSRKPGQRAQEAMEPVF